MSVNPLKLVRMAALLFALPVLGTCAPLTSSISVNASCYVGNCDAPDAIGVGQSAAGTFNFLYTFADGDQYSITGTFANSYPGQNLSFKVTATYLNNFGNIFVPSVQNDDLAFVMFQNFYDPVGSSWEGKYCQNIPFNVDALGRANGNTYFDGNEIGFIHGNQGKSDQSNCADLAFTSSQNASDTMHTETFLDFTFLGGNMSGALISSNPEPVQTIPIALGLIGFASISMRRKRGKS